MAAITKRRYEEVGCEKMIMTGDTVDILSPNLSVIISLLIKIMGVRLLLHQLKTRPGQAAALVML